MNKFMEYHEYAERRVALEHAVVATYEREAEEREVINLECEQLIQRMWTNRMRLEQLHKGKEQERKNLQKAIKKLNKDYGGEEVQHG